MTDKLVNQLVELTSIDGANDKLVIQDASDDSELKFVVPNNVTPDASDTVKGKVELATTAETTTGTDATRAVTPKGLHDMTSLSGAAWFKDEDNMASDSATTVPSQQSVKAYGDRALNPTLNINPLYAPQGFMINGKLSVTNSGSGLTVAIKTLAGTDPSATDPVYVRIGDTVRTISAALPVTKANGTNWCNSGSAELATKEIDYFAYLVWDSNSSAVGLTFARIPYANLVSEFSSTTTNEKYCAGQSDFTPTDEVEVIGRFAATLSAGAGYTWSVPTYTAINLIQRPIYETRWLSFTPTYNNTIGNGTNGFDYKVIGNAVHVRQTFSVGSTTTTGSVLNWTIPFTLAANENRYVSGSCRILDNGTAYFLAVPYVVDTTHISWLPHNDVGSGQLTNTRPMTWATGDSLLGQFKFDIA